MAAEWHLRSTVSRCRATPEEWILTAAGEAPSACATAAVQTSAPHQAGGIVPAAGESFAGIWCLQLNHMTTVSESGAGFVTLQLRVILQCADYTNYLSGLPIYSLLEGAETAREVNSGSLWIELTRPVWPVNSTQPQTVPDLLNLRGGLS